MQPERALAWTGPFASDSPSTDRAIDLASSMSFDYAIVGSLDRCTVTPGVSAEVVGTVKLADVKSRRVLRVIGAGSQGGTANISLSGAVSDVARGLAAGIVGPVYREAQPASVKSGKGKVAVNEGRRSLVIFPFAATAQSSKGKLYMEERANDLFALINEGIAANGEYSIVRFNPHLISLQRAIQERKCTEQEVKVPISSNTSGVKQACKLARILGTDSVVSTEGGRRASGSPEGLNSGRGIGVPTGRPRDGLLIW